MSYCNEGCGRNYNLNHCSNCGLIVCHYCSVKTGSFFPGKGWLCFICTKNQFQFLRRNPKICR